MRGPIISTERSKQTPTRGHARAQITTLGIIRVPYLDYGSSRSTQPQFMEFISSTDFFKK